MARTRRGWWVWVLLTLGTVGEAAAQQGMVVGRVLGRTGPVPAAEAELRRDTVVVGRAASDGFGVFRFVALEPGRYTVNVEALGYASGTASVHLEPGSVARVEIRLQASAVQLGTVRVQAQRRRARFEEEAGATVVELAGDQVERLPGLAEADVLRAVEVLPGVISTSDFSASFNVRGGAADQNLILLDGVPIYNPFHLGGLFGVFNADMVERTELLAGGFPPRYGGRVSSVLDVRSDAGDGRLAVDAGVSLLASRAVASAGVPSGLARRLGFDAIHGRVSARRSYFDVLLGPFFDFPYHLTDFQGVVRGWTGGGAWTVTGYTGADVLDLRESEDFPLPFRLDWGNDVGGVRWAGGWGGADLEARLSSSRFQTGIRFPDFEDTDIRSRIGEVRAGVDVRGPVGGVRLGAGGELARLEYDNLLETGGTVFGQAADHGWLGAVYGQLVWQSSVWLLEAGLRSDYWAPRSTDASWEPAPRLAVKRFLADGSAALKVATGRYTQVLHSLRDEEVPIGIDVWVTAGDRAPVVVSDQLQVGWEQFLDGWSGSVEAYYRTFDGVIAVNPADDLNDPGDDFVTGDGTSWGADLVVRREPRSERTVDGWIAVSFLRAERTFPDPLDPEGGMVTYPPIYDRRLDVDLVLRYPLPGGVEGGLRFNFGSGLPYTRPVGAYPYYSYEIGDGQLVPQNGQADEPQTAVVLGDRNGERYPAYHRLDLSFRKEYRRTWGSITPFLDVLNVYNRRDNVLFYFFDYAAEPPVRTGISMLPILPTLGAEVRF